jgi:hypothetical protein
MSKPSDERSFAVFWGEFGRTYLAVCLRVAWQLPLAVLVAGFLARLLQCYGSEEVKREIACAALSHPWAMFLSWVEFIPYVFLLMPIGLLPILFLEWLKYRKDEPSAFTHGGWKIEGPPGYARRLKEVGAETFAVAGVPVQARVLAENHRRIEGDFSEAMLLDHLRRKFARIDNKPLVDSKDHLVWKITQSSGTEVHIDLQRHPTTDPPVWTMRTEFYTWAGRKNPPRLAHTYITEFVCRGPSSTQP